MVEEMGANGAMGGGECIPWTHTTEPPPFIWTEGTQSAWVQWHPHPPMCRALWATVLERMDAYQPLIGLVFDRYKALADDFQRQKRIRHTGR
jgi:hypothetical protein